MRSKVKGIWTEIRDAAREDPPGGLVGAAFATAIAVGAMLSSIALLGLSERLVRGIEDLLMVAGVVLLARVALVLDPEPSPYVKPGLGRLALGVLGVVGLLGLVALAVHYRVGDPLLEEALGRVLHSLTTFAVAVVASMPLVLRDHPRPVCGTVVAVCAAVLVGLGLGHENLIDLTFRFAAWGVAGASVLLMLRQAPDDPGWERAPG